MHHVLKMPIISQQNDLLRKIRYNQLSESLKYDYMLRISSLPL